MLHLKTIFFVFFFALNSHFAVAQNYHWWWYEYHEYDGVTPWQNYLTMSPDYFGPNAFPIPDINQGRLKTNIELESALEGHFNSHEQTYNLYTKLFIPLQKDKVGITFSMIPIEFYSYDTIIRDKRFSRNHEGKGNASGDLYIGTQIQLLKDHPKWPDLLIGINIRTASGNGYESARFADSPGYFFDLSAGKTYSLKKSFLQSLRVYTLIGFYVWQTNLAAYFQDDAILYGTGIQLNSKIFKWSNEIGGFYGYLNNGDRPMVYRSRLESTRTNSLNMSVQFEYGMHDYNFRSLRFSLVYKLNR
ncbi:MAG: hypothetical protein J7J72_07605 [Bacteroidales bacterium]|nr:hypothetical protein [Bacteroidales bacterium]